MEWEGQRVKHGVGGARSEAWWEGQRVKHGVGGARSEAWSGRGSHVASLQRHVVDIGHC